MGSDTLDSVEILLMEWNGERLRELRDLRGWTQAELATIASVDQSNISRWEGNKARPGFDDVIKLADALKVSVEAFRQAVGQKPIRSRYHPGEQESDD